MNYFRRLLLCLVLITALNALGCKEKNTPNNPIKFDKISERTITITHEKQFSGFPLGLSLDQGETYIQDDINPKGKFLIHFIDLENDTVKRTLELKAGDFQSPTEFFSPTHVEFLDGRYYILDQFEKIVVYDQQFHHLYSSKFAQVRYFMDFFKQKENLCFVIATHRSMGKISSKVVLYELPEKQKPMEEKTISENIEIQSIFSYMRGGGKDFYKGFFWPSVSGFEKDQAIFYSIGDSQDIHVYRIGSGKNETFTLPYLLPKRYTNENAFALGHYHSDGGDAFYKKRTGAEQKYIAYPGDCFHFGIYDVGQGKIGVVADFNQKEMKYRLDIIDTQKWQYIESIWLPVGYSFTSSIYATNRGLAKTFINVDKGFYIYSDIVGEDEDYVTKIVRFK